MTKLLAIIMVTTALATGCTVVFPIVSAARHANAPKEESNQAVTNALVTGLVIDLFVIGVLAAGATALGGAD
jgi:hypothetical protein